MADAFAVYREEFRPVKAGSLGGEIGLLPVIVPVLDILLVREGNVLFGDSVLQFHDMLSKLDRTPGKAMSLLSMTGQENRTRKQNQNAICRIRTLQRGPKF
jgi:hypothetical protein